MTYDNPRLEMIRQVYHKRAAVQFFLIEVTKDEAREAANIISKYNEFRPSRFQEFIELLPEDATIRIGREGSPLVHVSTSRWWGDELLSKMIELAEAARLKADQISMEDIFWCRIWWD